MDHLETAYFGGGCFWCLEAVFDQLAGVVSVESGYMGGRDENPTYKQVCAGDTGHVEVIRVDFDPAAITYHDLLEVFFTVHDPTTMNRQGNDVGTQYRSVIFYASEAQRREAVELITLMNAAHHFPSQVVTTVEPATTFWMAEGYHQEYFDNNSFQPYCQWVVAPKLKKFQKQFSNRLKG